MRIYTIYLATNAVNGKVYVGFDSSWPRRRRSHLTEAFYQSGHTYHTPLHSAIRKYGRDAFDWQILYQSWDYLHTLQVMEKHFITEYQSYVGFADCQGYNLTLGGEGQKGRAVSAETKAKKSKALFNIPSPLSREIHTPLGIFVGVRTTARLHNIPERTLTYRISSSRFPEWYYVENANTDSNPILKLTGAGKGVNTPLGEFASVRQCSIATGIPTSTIQDRVRSPHQRDWYYSGYETKQGTRTITTPHGRFDSIASASRQLNLPKSTIAARIRSEQQPEWTYEDQAVTK